MAWQQIGEGELVDAGLVVGGLGKESPGEELSIFYLTIGALFGDGSFICDSCDEDHVEGFEGYFGVGDCKEELAGKEGAGRLTWVAVEDQRR